VGTYQILVNSTGVNGRGAGRAAAEDVCRQRGAIGQSHLGGTAVLGLQTKLTHVFSQLIPAPCWIQARFCASVPPSGFRMRISLTPTPIERVQAFSSSPVTV
jgi:hypothetical protein